MFYLGVIHEQGLGTKADKKAAFEWYQRGAQSGHPESQFNLGNAYKHGRGTAVSEEQASAWWQKAADQGLVNAQFNLALQYYAGLGVQQDMTKSYALLQQAADGGHKRAKALMASGRIPAPQVAGQADPVQTPSAEPPSQPALGETAKDNDGSARAASAGKAGNSLAITTPGGEEFQVPVYPLSELASGVSGHYTIQLAVMTKKAYLVELLQDDQLAPEAIVASGKQGETTRYYVLLGAFMDRVQAEQRLAELTPKLRSLKPWIRAFTDVGR